MDASQKSPREMIVDRLLAADVNTGNLAIEAAGGSVRVTGSVASESARDRALAVLSSAQASGVRVSHAIEVRPGETPAENEEPSADNRFPPEPA
ncbi:MAG: hypothetical protein ACHQPH_15920 [Reyranellales bacterium]|jgi:osmotically-inducible protein OsmY